MYLTGSTGFVGSALLDLFIQLKYKPIVFFRGKLLPEIAVEQRYLDLSLMDNGAQFETLFSNQDADGVVIHMAARVHKMNDLSVDSLSKFRHVNTDGTLALASAAAEAGIKRFVFLSSIKVNGEASLTTPFSPDDVNIPSDPYGVSKYEAEQGLLKLSKETGMEVVIIRCPLVYGPGVKANFLSMLRWLNRGIPLPLGLIHNKRSLVALENLVDFIAYCADFKKTPKAANHIFLISDGEDVSTTELLKKVAKAFGKKALLLPVPEGLMTFAAKLLGKEDVASRLFGSLQVDSSKARDLLGWRPVITMDEQLKKTADHYLLVNKK